MLTISLSRTAHEFLKKLDFSPEEIKLYISLVQHGPSTLLSISRHTGIERTKLYRILDSLAQKGIIEEVPRYKQKTIKAADISTIELLVKEKERQAKSLNASFDEFRGFMKTLEKPFPGNNVVYYKGKEGMKQMTWHILRCKGLFRTYSYCFWNDILGDSFVEKLNAELVTRKFKIHDLYSDEYIEFKNKWMASGKGKPEGDWSFWHSRYLPETMMKIHLNLDVYNDIVSYYYWEDDEIFGVEIYNERVANLQKQMHDVLWNMAQDNSKLDWRIKDWE